MTATRLARWALAASLAAAAAGCAPSTADLEAGSTPGGGFGNATLANRLAMTRGDARGAPLDGRYAAVIYGDYLESGLSEPRTEVVVVETD